MQEHNGEDPLARFPSGLIVVGGTGEVKPDRRSGGDQ